MTLKKHHVKSAISRVVSIGGLRAAYLRKVKAMRRHDLPKGIVTESTIRQFEDCLERLSGLELIAITELFSQVKILNAVKGDEQ